MPEVKYTADWGVLKVTSATEIPLTDNRWAVIQNLLRIFGEELHPDKITYESGEYEIKLVDGRKWNQTITFPVPPTMNPSMTFDVSDPWTHEEWGWHQGIREWIINAVVDYGLSAFHCTWEWPEEEE